MKLQTGLLVLLAATTLGGAVLAWRQYAELVELRAAAMNRDERADLQKRVWDLEKQNRELQDRLAAQRPVDADAIVAEAATTSRGDRAGRGDGREGRGGRGGPPVQQMNAIRDLMAKPEVQAMINLQQKAGIEARYATLFKNLNLGPEQVSQLTTLLAERTTTMQDVMAAAREQGINPRENPDAFRKLIADAQNDINSSIKSVIGDDGFAQLANYEQTLPQRNVVNELQQRLSYTSTPLTAAQAEQLVQILATNQPPRATTSTSVATTDTPRPAGRGPGGFEGGFGGPGGRGPDFGGMIAGVLGGGGIPMGGPDGGRGGATAPVTPAAVAQAQTVLAPAQLTALQQIQQQQQAQQQLRQLVNETLQANQPTPGAPSGTAPASGTTPAPGAPTGGRRGRG